jgi:hypothetical protein
MNTAELIVLIVVVVLIANAIWFLVRTRKKRKCNCGYNCGACEKCSAPDIIVPEDPDKKDE